VSRAQRANAVKITDPLGHALVAFVRFLLPREFAALEPFAAAFALGQGRVLQRKHKGVEMSATGNTTF
jgi:hypothetical protein